VSEKRKMLFFIQEIGISKFFGIKGFSPYRKIVSKNPSAVGHSSLPNSLT
jgi:hypothetical protein